VAAEEQVTAGSAMYRIVQWATGSMGRTALRRIIDHPDLELVGVYVYDPRKAGRDAGELARRPLTGVRATNRVADIVALKPDVVIHTPRLTDPYSQQNGTVVELLAAGIDVISTAGFHYPDCHGLAYAGPLRDACLRGGSTLAGLGLNPGFIAERVALLLTGMCAQLTQVACYEIADASSMPAPEFVFGIMGFGTDPAVRDITKGPLAALYGDLFMEVFHAVAAALGTHVLRLEPEHRLTLAPHDLAIQAGTIRAGTVAATEWRWRGELADGRVLVHSVTWTADPRLHGGTARDAAHWRIEIDGRPNVRVSIAIADPDPAAPHMRAAADATIALALRAIPEVCAAPPGFYRPPYAGGFRARLAPPASG
jgi:2,4-diaminopentanoate dehydrogenase